MHIEMKRTGRDFRMEAVNPKGNAVVMDNPSNNGAMQQGASPMELLLMGIAGCSSIDILTILEKRGKVVEDLRVSVNAERETDQTPAYFNLMEAQYHLTGQLDPDKVRMAVELSLSKYCTVAKIIEKTVPIDFRVFLNGQEI